MSKGRKVPPARKTAVLRGRPIRSLVHEALRREGNAFIICDDAEDTLWAFEELRSRAPNAYVGACIEELLSLQHNVSGWPIYTIGSEALLEDLRAMTRSKAV